MAKAEQPGRRMTHRLNRHLGIRIGSVAAREQALLAEEALAATDRKGDDDAVSHFQIGDLGAEFDHLAHILMAQDVAVFHRRLIAVEQMEIGAADRTSCDFDDGISWVLNLWIGNRIDANVAFAVPA
jgi:hypothetical protein